MTSKLVPIAMGSVDIRTIQMRDTNRGLAVK
jgi:hypothetical protein